LKKLRVEKKLRVAGCKLAEEPSGTQLFNSSTCNLQPAICNLQPATLNWRAAAPTPNRRDAASSK